MTSGDAQPTQPLPDWAYAQPAMPRRRRVWPWIVAVVVVVGLVVAAWLLAEAIVRDVVVRTVRAQVVNVLRVPADHRVDVEVDGAVLPQLIGGRLRDVRIASQDVTLGLFTGDLVVTAQDVATSGAFAAASAQASLALDETQLRSLLATVEGFPAESLGIDEPYVTASTELSLFGVSLPIGLSLTPSASDGQLVLTPESIQVAGIEASADQLRAQFGVAANTVLRDWPVCIAQYLPVGVVLTGVSVEGGHVVADLDIDPAIASDPALRVDGTC